MIETPRLVLRPWSPADVDGAVDLYSAPAVRRWLEPAIDGAGSPATMRTVLAQWAEHDRSSSECFGHWAVLERSTSRIVGGVTLHRAPHASESVGIAWALVPAAWGHGYASEAGDALVRWAMHECGVLDVFAIVQPGNERGLATAERIGMEWVTELGRTQGGRYQVYRIRHGDLDWED